MSQTINYILSFLLYGNDDAQTLVGYTNDPEQAKQYKVNIIPSPASPLNNPERNWQDFYPEVIKALQSRKIDSNTDIISLTCFFISRAEEIICTQRDQHNRFLAQHSILGTHNLLLIPLLDEYSRYLIKKLELPLPTQTFSQINLTHDVDILCKYRRLRGSLSGIKHRQWLPVARALHNRTNDPAWTFPFLAQQDSKIPNANIIYFIKAAGKHPLDRPQYNLHGSDFKALLNIIKSQNAQIGLHTSYDAGEWHEGENRIAQQKHFLEHALDIQPITLNRHHYLRSTTIDNMQQLADAGITDDYTMGFADHAGFRLLTSRPVRWINPKTLQLTSLTLHPLTVMDCTLSNENYMNLTEDEAYYTCQQLIDKTRQNGGELNLLWHNSIFTPDTYHTTLYKSIIDYIASLDHNLFTKLFV